MQKRKIAVLVGILSLLSAQVRAQNAETVADVRCVIVGMRMIEMTNQTYRASGMMATLYYIGRLDGRTPNLNLENLIFKELKTMTAVDYSAEAKRCGIALTARGQEITKMGKDLVERGHEMMKNAGPRAK
jgi:hypothetical protein